MGPTVLSIYGYGWWSFRDNIETPIWPLSIDYFIRLTVTVLVQSFSDRSWDFDIVSQTFHDRAWISYAYYLGDTITLLDTRLDYLPWSRIKSVQSQLSPFSYCYRQEFNDAFWVMHFGLFGLFNTFGYF